MGMNLRILHPNSEMKHSSRSPAVTDLDENFWIKRFMFFKYVFFVIATINYRNSVPNIWLQSTKCITLHNLEIISFYHETFSSQIARFPSIELRFRMWFCNLFDHLMLCNVVLAFWQMVTSNKNFVY